MERMSACGKVDEVSHDLNREKINRGRVGKGLYHGRATDVQASVAVIIAVTRSRDGWNVNRRMDQNF